MKRFLLSFYLRVHRSFHFSRVETNGFVVLLVLMSLLLLVPTLLLPALSHYNPAADQEELDKFAAELASRRAPNRQYAGGKSRYPSKYSRTPMEQVALAPFNPNTLTAQDWEARGVPRYVAARLVRYGQAIKGFQAKDQIQKAYGLEPAVYARLAPFIELPEHLPPRTKPAWARHDSTAYAGTRRPAYAANAPRFKRKPTNLQPFDLNAADTAQLQQIRGIGRKTALRLVAYRERLGGFVKEEQLQEVFGLPPDLADSLRKYTFVREGYVPTPLHVNRASFGELKAHPYVGPRLARVLVAFREQHGAFQQLEDLRQIRILEPAGLEKLRPYLGFAAP
ncbi:helix-hairpin-helix domain-containing protein [Hymenobacter sp. J193]|uniref:helix-hairpin-helix domain-containing protein n=1 Tax=Hymenobacter sp. J193 TaxID=2898429 RepID=UPI002150E36D|nr:helix-hairpin-helix domain-containing protein [Hymenobacter sp. J193]MCR5888733.1 helix-hairpin-helix domain-containing protein [Hymenobacter sp. J193]